jgi:cytoskeletal protein RodZ
VDEVTFSLIVSPAIVLVAGYWWWKTRKAMRAEAAKRNQRATVERPQPKPVPTAPSPSDSERFGRSTATASRSVGRSRAGVQRHDPSKAS